MVTRPIERREENSMAPRASLILLLTATLTASGLAAAYEDPGPERARWDGAGADTAGFVPVGEYRRHHRHHPYYLRDRYPYSYYQPYPQPGYGAPHWRPLPPGYYPAQPAYEPRPYYGPPRHW
ncbi:hypothetical protein [Pseudomonas oryzihabitans]|uniref:hypothetical protein n=1 Tax=Pseudomonas oryzihabitans TaxID=47885 RepID=UPI002893860F|nr:hypothetical protein [Pseudomonas oryzihabitans]MDT3722388.1 hypothetical protein [Pseudomonas oryzihabitans]